MKKIASLLLIIFALIAYILFSKGANKYDIEAAKQALETGNTTAQTINA
jgi:predicted outer membrane protein